MTRQNGNTRNYLSRRIHLAAHWGSNGNDSPCGNASILEVKLLADAIMYA